MTLDLSFEKQYWQQHLDAVAGVDEVGKGCLAGPVFAAAVCFDNMHYPISGVNDSKKISPRAREIIATEIKKQARAWAIGVTDVETINKIGITKATYIAMNTAIRQLGTTEVVLVDGPRVPALDGASVSQMVPIIKGDSLCYSIAAASIIAKVARDEVMHQLHNNFPEYGWRTNKGYATRIHREAIMKYGPTKYHRTLFIRNVCAEMVSNKPYS